MRRRTVAATCTLLALAGHMGLATAQEYPDKPIRLVVGFAAGSTVDSVARTLADGLTKRFGQPVIVENKTGANGSLASEAVVRAKPDGYTMLVSNTSSLTINPLLYKNSFGVKDFTPITTITTYPLLLTVNPANPKTRHVKTFADLVALAKAQQSTPLNFGSAGNGNMLQIASERLSRAAGFKATHIPYRGGAPMQLALLASEVDFNFDTLSAVPQVKAGKLRVLAVSENTRWEDLPEVPTLAELGYQNFVISAWLGLLAPAGTPPRVVERIHQAVVEMGNDPAIRTRLQTQGRVAFTTPKALTDQINTELAQNAEIIKEANIVTD